ncbi:hypothetical protein GJ744_007542 [Endocarpon pusillum]|uniref:Uncharacterized protein n=1 Tax=Endocarpon pusillum TaxID=364733 RepID=A0A8H7AMB3_9EURO|nr:hypothetical protein GJ744_007542 [Endocarpon pusillum]
MLAILTSRLCSHLRLTTRAHPPGSPPCMHIAYRSHEKQIQTSNAVQEPVPHVHGDSALETSIPALEIALGQDHLGLQNIPR